MAQVLGLPHPRGRPGIAPAMTGMWGVNHQMEDISLPLFSLCSSTFQKKKNEPFKTSDIKGVKLAGVGEGLNAGQGLHGLGSATEENPVRENLP